MTSFAVTHTVQSTMASPIVISFPDILSPVLTVVMSSLKLISVIRWFLVSVCDVSAFWEFLVHR